MKPGQVKLERSRDPSAVDTSGFGDDFYRLVAAEIAKGAPPSVAGQRVINRFGARPNAAAIRKSAGAVVGFMAAVDAVMLEQRCLRNEAMSIVRKRDPALFSQFQEV